MGSCGPPAADGGQGDFAGVHTTKLQIAQQRFWPSTNTKTFITKKHPPGEEAGATFRRTEGNSPVALAEGLTPCQPRDGRASHSQEMQNGLRPPDLGLS